MPEYIVLSTVPMETVEELIRCKDCKKQGTDRCAMHYELAGDKYCQWNNPDDFCSWAERREE